LFHINVVPTDKKVPVAIAATLAKTVTATDLQQITTPEQK
jgi:hypothetical protein